MDLNPKSPTLSAHFRRTMRHTHSKYPTYNRLRNLELESFFQQKKGTKTRQIRRRSEQASRGGVLLEESAKTRLDLAQPRRRQQQPANGRHAHRPPRASPPSTAFLQLKPSSRTSSHFFPRAFANENRVGFRVQTCPTNKSQKKLG